MTKLAIITGYSSGLGLSFAENLLKKEWHVIGVTRSHRAKEIEAAYPDKIHYVSGSVANQETVDQVFSLAKELGGASLMINCAGQGVFGKVGSYTADDIAAVMEGNLNGLILFTDRSVVHMQESGGDIINVMSTAAKKLRAAESAYTAAKWGAKAYTRTIRDAVKSEKLPIRVFEIYPCGMKTAFWNDAIRPVTDGKIFPDPNTIAETVLNAVFDSKSSYQQEFTFERS